MPPLLSGVWFQLLCGHHRCQALPRRARPFMPCNAAHTNKHMQGCRNMALKAKAEQGGGRCHLFRGRCREGENGTAGRVAGCFEGGVLLPHSQAAMGLAACLITSSTTFAGRAARQKQPPPAGAGCLAPPLAAAPLPALPAPTVCHQQQGAGGGFEGVWPVLVGDGAPGLASCPKQQPAAVAIMS